MKKLLVCLLPALVLLLAATCSSRADQFTEIQNNPDTYWVPAPPGSAAPGPPPGYYGAYYGPPPPYYYGPPPPPVRLFFGFHFH
jgi:hypothetical protein